MEARLRLSKQDSTQFEEEKTKMVNILYQNSIGSLMHVMVNTWLHMAYAINSVAQYLSNIGKKTLACNLENNKILETNYE